MEGKQSSRNPPDAAKGRVDSLKISYFFVSSKVVSNIDLGRFLLAKHAHTKVEGGSSMLNWHGCMDATVSHRSYS